MAERGKEREQQLVMEFLHATNSVRRIHGEKLLIGLSASEFRFLRAIQEFHWKYPDKIGIYVNDLAQKMYVTKSGASKMLRQLEEHGLIERQIDCKDRRNTFVCLTEKGKQLGELQKERFDCFLMQIVDDLGEQRFEEIMDGICDLTQAITNRIQELHKQDEM